MPLIPYKKQMFQILRSDDQKDAFPTHVFPTYTAAWDFLREEFPYAMFGELLYTFEVRLAPIELDNQPSLKEIAHTLNTRETPSEIQKRVQRINNSIANINGLMNELGCKKKPVELIEVPKIKTKKSHLSLVVDNTKKDNK